MRMPLDIAIKKETRFTRLVPALMIRSGDNVTTPWGIKTVHTIKHSIVKESTYEDITLPEIPVILIEFSPGTLKCIPTFLFIKHYAGYFHYMRDLH